MSGAHDPDSLDRIRHLIDRTTPALQLKGTPTRTEVLTLGTVFYMQGLAAGLRDRDRRDADARATALERHAELLLKHTWPESP